MCYKRCIAWEYSLYHINNYYLVFEIMIMKIIKIFQWLFQFQKISIFTYGIIQTALNQYKTNIGNKYKDDLIVLKLGNKIMSNFNFSPCLYSYKQFYALPGSAQSLYSLLCAHAFNSDKFGESYVVLGQLGHMQGKCLIQYISSLLHTVRFYRVPICIYYIFIKNLLHKFNTSTTNVKVWFKLQKRLLWV